MARLRKIKVVYKKLLREKSWGIAYDDYIEIDPRLRGKKHLEIMLHELLHVVCPELSEEQVIRKSVLMANTLWGDGYRRCDHDESQPLQDGST
jgi:hypothetical protein